MRLHAKFQAPSFETEVVMRSQRYEQFQPPTLTSLAAHIEHGQDKGNTTIIVDYQNVFRKFQFSITALTKIVNAMCCSKDVQSVQD